MIRVISWNNGESARALSQLVSNGKLVKRDAASTIPPCSTLINLGCSTITRNYGATRILNTPVAVEAASSKAASYGKLAYVMPPATTDKEEALFWCIRDNLPIVCRTIDNGHSGAGIVLHTKESLLQAGDLPSARLYVQAIQKRREYRVHVGYCKGDYLIIDVCRKVRRSGVDDSDRPFVWNHGNDFIFQRSGVTVNTVPHRVIAKARVAVRAMGLHFGAVDVIVQRGGELNDAPVYVLEVNTSPGMEGTTLQRYAEYFTAADSGSSFECWTTKGEFGDEYSA